MDRTIPKESVVMPGSYLTGRYQVYPLAEDLPEHAPSWNNLDEEKLHAMFPDGIEAYCVLALVCASGEYEHVAGATYDYIDRLAVSALRRMHGRTAWKRLGKWIISFGTYKRLLWADVFILGTSSFMQLFWGSMRKLVAQGYVDVQKRDIDGERVEVFYPTKRLITRFSIFLAD